jgi:hypothetical protein
VIFSLMRTDIRPFSLLLSQLFRRHGATLYRAQVRLYHLPLLVRPFFSSRSVAQTECDQRNDNGTANLSSLRTAGLGFPTRKSFTPERVIAVPGETFFLRRQPYVFCMRAGGPDG